MKAKELIKQQDGPRKRITDRAKHYAKLRLGIQAGEKDISNRDVFNAMFEYLEQLEAAILFMQEQVKKGKE